MAAEAHRQDAPEFVGHGGTATITEPQAPASAWTGPAFKSDTSSGTADVPPRAVETEDVKEEVPKPPHKSEESYEWINRIGLELLAPRPKPRPAWRIPVAVALVAGLITIAALFYSGTLQKYFDGRLAPQQTSSLASTSPASEPPGQPPAASDRSLDQRAAAKPDEANALVERGREHARRKEWAKAEASFRSALEASPANRGAALGLSDVLYQEQKYEESAAVLNKLSAGK
jgi:tetratricopeptide (TPR) repeat protein